MNKHWSHCTPYAIARALSDQHGVDWDRAMELAWYAMKNESMPSLHQVLARMSAVKNVPVVSEKVLEMFQNNLRDKRGMLPRK